MKPLIEIKPNRFTHLILFPFAGGLATLFFWVAYIKEPFIFGDDLTGKVVLNLLILAGIFICYKSISQFIKNKPTFGVYDEGFISNTHGVSSGLMLWKDIKRIEEKVMTKEDETSDNTLAVYFKNPDHYANSQTGIIKGLLKLSSATQVMKKIDSSSNESEGLPLIILAGSLGKRYSQIKLVMEEKIKQHA